MIDCWYITFMVNISLYSGWEQVKQYLILVTIEWNNRGTIVDWEYGLESWFGRENECVFSGYNAPQLLRNPKWSVAKRASSMTLSKYTTPTKEPGQAVWLTTPTKSREHPSLSNTCECARQLCWLSEQA